MNGVRSNCAIWVNKGDMCGLIKVLKRRKILKKRHEEDRINDRPTVTKGSPINGNQAQGSNQRTVGGMCSVKKEQGCHKCLLNQNPSETRIFRLCNFALFTTRNLNHGWKCFSNMLASQDISVPIQTLSQTSCLFSRKSPYLSRPHHHICKTKGLSTLHERITWGSC